MIPSPFRVREHLARLLESNAHAYRPGAPAKVLRASGTARARGSAAEPGTRGGKRAFNRIDVRGVIPASRVQCRCRPGDCASPESSLREQSERRLFHFRGAVRAAAESADARYPGGAKLRLLYRPGPNNQPRLPFAGETRAPTLYLPLSLGLSSPSGIPTDWRPSIAGLAFRILSRLLEPNSKLPRPFLRYVPGAPAPALPVISNNCSRLPLRRISLSLSLIVTPRGFFHNVFSFVRWGVFFCSPRQSCRWKARPCRARNLARLHLAPSGAYYSCSLKLFLAYDCITFCAITLVYNSRSFFPWQRLLMLEWNYPYNTWIPTRIYIFVTKMLICDLTIVPAVIYP